MKCIIIIIKRLRQQGEQWPTSVFVNSNFVFGYSNTFRDPLTCVAKLQGQILGGSYVQSEIALSQALKHTACEGLRCHAYFVAASMDVCNHGARLASTRLLSLQGNAVAYTSEVESASGEMRRRVLMLTVARLSFCKVETESGWKNMMRDKPIRFSS